MRVATTRARAASMRRIGYGLVDGDPAGLVAEPLQVDPDGVRGEQRHELVGPLDDGDAVAVEQLLEPQVDQLGEAAGTVRVEVVDRQAAAVVVDQHEGRARHVPGDPEAARQSLQEARLPGAQLSGARDHRTGPEAGAQRLADRLGRRRVTRHEGPPAHGRGPARRWSAAGSASTMSPATIATSPRAAAVRSPASPWR